MPNRMFNESFLRDKRVAKLAPFEETVYSRMLLAVDDGGNVDANPLYLRSVLFPVRDVAVEEVALACDSLCELGLLSTYEVGGERYLHYTDFEHNQKLRYFHLQFPTPSDVRPQTDKTNVLEEHEKRVREIIDAM